jgi:hypothetical protein
MTASAESLDDTCVFPAESDRQAVEGASSIPLGQCALSAEVASPLAPAGFTRDVARSVDIGMGRNDVGDVQRPCEQQFSHCPCHRARERADNRSVTTDPSTAGRAVFPQLAKVHQDGFDLPVQTNVVGRRRPCRAAPGRLLRSRLSNPLGSAYSSVDLLGPVTATGARRRDYIEPARAPT